MRYSKKGFAQEHIQGYQQICFHKSGCPSKGFWISILANFILLKLSLRDEVPVLFSELDFEDCCKLEEFYLSMKRQTINNFVFVKMENFVGRVS